MKMKDDEIVLIVCNSETAKKIITTDPDIKESLIITDVMPDTDAVIVPKQDFLDWVYKGGEQE